MFPQSPRDPEAFVQVLYEDASVVVLACLLAVFGKVGAACFGSWNTAYEDGVFWPTEQGNDQDSVYVARRVRNLATRLVLCTVMAKSWTRCA